MRFFLLFSFAESPGPGACCERSKARGGWGRLTVRQTPGASRWHTAGRPVLPQVPDGALYGSRALALSAFKLCQCVAAPSLFFKKIIYRDQNMYPLFLRVVSNCSKARPQELNFFRIPGALRRALLL